MKSIVALPGGELEYAVLVALWDLANASATVITREEIERRRATSVQEVLRGVPGLGVANSGGLGKATSVFLRGTNSDHALFLVDGIRIGSATLGTAAFQDIPIDRAFEVVLPGWHGTMLID